jgi:hypothetical protein
MDKEVKIGLSVIVVLMVIFGVLLTRRLTRSNTDDDFANDAKIVDKQKPTDKPNKEVVKERAETKAIAQPAAKPTVLSASATVSKAPSSISNEGDPWATASNKNKVEPNRQETHQGKDSISLVHTACAEIG